MSRVAELLREALAMVEAPPKLTVSLPKFDALGRQRWEEAEIVMAEHAEHLRKINSRIGTLAYFGDETPDLPPDSYGFLQWQLNSTGYQSSLKFNSGYIFTKNTEGQWEATDQMVESQGHEPTVCFPSRSFANACLHRWLETQLAIDPGAVHAPWRQDDGN